jgi:alpha-L-fucosidase
MAWHEREQFAFIHFTTNTFTDKEWGYGDEPESVFNPTAFDAEQWAKVIKEAGMTGIVLTCKHHDGFCLWPSAYTEHSVKNSPWMDGTGDVVKAVSDACKKYGLFFGVYLSPWDRNYARYAFPEYVTYYRNQLTELLTNYGEVMEVWFDGANGGDGYYGGARETRKIDANYYDWQNTYALVNKLAPKAVMFGGPTLRWCGNEKGFVSETNWNPPGEDGSGSSWLPAEVDVSIRPGWFYHERENERVKSPEELFKIYLTSVGRGSSLILNLPPDRRGLLHENDVRSLLGWKKLIDSAFATNLAAGAKAKADTWRGKSKQYAAANVTDGNTETYWATDDDVTTGSIEISVPKGKKLNYILLQEYIRLGQRVKSFTVEAKKGDKWEKVAEATTLGYKRILPLGGVETSAIRVNITDAKACPLISTIAIY